MNYFIFEGDGRHSVKPVLPPEGTRPMSVTKAAARRLIDAFLHNGTSFHSGAGSTLWVIAAWAFYAGVPIRINTNIVDGAPVGYEVEKA